MASSGIEPDTLQSIVREFESMSVSAMGAHLGDGQLQVIYDKFAPQIGKQLSDKLVA